jgi:hypothetical protein
MGKKKYFEIFEPEEVQEAMINVERGSMLNAQENTSWMLEIMDKNHQWLGILPESGYLSVDGKEKSGKSTLNKMICTAHVSYQGIYENVKLNIDPRKKIFVGDSEQSKADIALDKYTIAKSAGLKSFPEDVIMYRLLSLESDAAMKMNLVINYVMELKHDLGWLIIDGIADLIYNDNDKGDSRDLLGELVSLKNEYGFCMSTVIHQNKKDSAAANQLGAVCYSKCNYQVKMEPPIYDGGPFMVKSGHAIRGQAKRFSPFEVYYQDNMIKSNTNPVRSPDIDKDQRF